MLDIQITIENDQVVIKGLAQLAAGMPAVAKRGLRRIAAGLAFAR